MAKNAFSWQRLGRTIAIVVVVSLSLLCFPHWLPWMVAFWLGWHSVQLLRGKPGYLPLATCAVILLVRLAPPLPTMLLLGFTLAVTAFVRFRGSSGLRSQRVGRIAAAVVWLVWELMFWEYRQAAECNNPIQTAFDPARPIVCIGDSLTQGMIPDRGYPGIHSNEYGSKQIAEFVRDALVELYGDEVLSTVGHAGSHLRNVR